MCDTHKNGFTREQIAKGFTDELFSKTIRVNINREKISIIEHLNFDWKSSVIFACYYYYSCYNKGTVLIGDDWYCINCFNNHPNIDFLIR